MSQPAEEPVVGEVFRLHAKPETPGERGLPKRSIPRARVTRLGVEGDFNRWRQETREGDPAYALLILPLETIEGLNREGWPVRPGDLGENITTRGIPYGDLASGRTYRYGTVVAETTKPCTPCDNLALLPYVGREKEAEFLRTMNGRRGWYARVLQGGQLRVGDPIRRVRPADLDAPPSTAAPS